jgi:hypothetical protein
MIGASYGMMFDCYPGSEAPLDHCASDGCVDDVHRPPYEDDLEDCIASTTAPQQR